METETVIRNVRDLDQTDRCALERVVGHQLLETQQVVLNVLNVDLETKAVPAGEGFSPSAPWGNIYDGLNDAKVDRLDSAIRQRANLTRAFE